MMRKYICLWLFVSLEVMAQPFTFDKVSVEMLYPEYWINKDKSAHEVVMKPGDIAEYNKKLTQLLPEVMVDITAYQDKDHKKIHYGFVVTPSDLRTYPSTEKLHKTGNIEFDAWQETRIDAATPVLILASSEDKKFYDIQTSNYRGWVLAEHVAISEDKQAWLDYQHSKDFLVILGSELKLNYNPYTPELSGLVLSMGQKLPLATGDIPKLIDNQTIAGQYVVIIPIRNSQGKTEFKSALIPINEDVTLGYLPYTKANVIKQAFKMLGQRYSWGGANGRDCSSFIQSIYASMGLQLPRNTSQQHLIPQQNAAQSNDGRGFKKIKIDHIII